MTVKKASVKDLAEKAAAVKKEAAKTPAKAEAVKTEVKAEVKKEAAKAPAKKAAPAKKVETKVELFVEYQGGSQKVEDLVAKAKEVSGKKTVKALNVYYQPENNIVYFTADGDEGSFNL